MSFAEHPSSSDELFRFLLGQARTGDSEAMNEVLARPRPYLCRIARLRIPEEHQARLSARGAVQRTLISAHRHLDQFAGDSEGEFRQWLRMILVNKIRDSVRAADGRRRQHARRETSLEALVTRSGFAPCDDGGRSTLDVVIDMERKVRLRACIVLLPESYRRILQLRYEEGRRFKEIAAEMGKSTVAAKKLCARAVRALEDLLRAEDVFREAT
jgi:RNA polymerase sigma-70 factor (ECF subfamily)